MATPNKKRPEPTNAELHEGVLGFTMALRESIMSYYKGTCIQGFASLSAHNVGTRNVPLQVDPSQSRAYNYERQDHEMREPRVYSLLGSPMFELWKNDHEAILHPAVMSRSRYLEEVDGQLKMFFAKFLPDVKIVERDTKQSRKCRDGSEDLKLVYQRFDEDEDFQRILAGQGSQEPQPEGVEGPHINEVVEIPPTIMDYQLAWASAGTNMALTPTQLTAAHRRMMMEMATRRARQSGVRPAPDVNF